MTSNLPIVIGLKQIDDAIDHRNESQALIAAKCRALLRGYDKRWADSGYEAIEVEHVLWSDLYNPDTSRKSRSFQVSGKLDVICRLGLRTVVIDHKTTSQDITDPNGSYWRQLIVEGQVSHYMLLMWLNGMKADSALWDVVRKPQISPKKLRKAERASVVSSGSYFNFSIPEADRLALSQGEERETLTMFEARLTHDCCTERPDWYFQRRMVPRLDNEILEYARELWEHGQEMLHARNTNRHARNSGACMLYGSPCKFLGICSGYDTPDSDKWQRKEWVHPELPVIDGSDGRDVLTNSRIRCWQTCRRKEYLSYQLGIERQDEEEREALFFGNVWHAGQFAWWESFKKGVNNGNCTSESPASSVGNYGSSETGVAG